MRIKFAFIITLYALPLLGMEKYSETTDYQVLPLIRANIYDSNVVFIERTDEQPLITVRSNDPSKHLSVCLYPTELQISSKQQLTTETPEYMVMYPKNTQLNLCLTKANATISTINRLQALLRDNAKLSLNHFGCTEISLESDSEVIAQNGVGINLKLTATNGGNAVIDGAAYENVELIRNHPPIYNGENLPAISQISIRNAKIGTLKAKLFTAYQEKFTSENPSISVRGTVNKAKLKIFPTGARENIFVEEVTGELSTKVVETEKGGMDSSITVNKPPLL